MALAARVLAVMFGVPRVMVTEFPAATMVEAVPVAPNVTVVPPTKLLLVSRLPRGSWAAFVEFQTVSTSENALLAMRTTTAVLRPDQPARMLHGETGLEKVNVRMSPMSGRPAVPDTLTAWTSVAVRAVLSTVTGKAPWVPAFPATSVDVREYV